jgi:urea transport system permease protein
VPAAFVVAAVLLFAVAPLALSPFRLDQLGRYLCFAIVAVGIGLAWGRGGMLTLGQGVFFGMGAYLMAMHLKLTDAGPGGTPDFMALISSDGVPWWWEPFRCCPLWWPPCSGSRRSGAGCAGRTSRSCRRPSPRRSRSC